MEVVQHRGGCHCGKIRFTVMAPTHLIAIDCSCSICSMKRNTHFIVPSSNFKLDDTSESHLSTYQFGTKKAKHLFCRHCGICSFYIPRSNPDGVAVTVHCLDEGTVKTVEMKQFDGKNWEQAFSTSDIEQMSKA